VLVEGTSAVVTPNVKPLVALLLKIFPSLETEVPPKENPLDEPVEVLVSADVPTEGACPVVGAANENPDGLVA